VYLVRREQRLGAGRISGRDSRELRGHDRTSGEQPDRANGRAQVSVAECRVEFAVGPSQPVFGPVHGPLFQRRQHRPADRAHPVRIRGRRDARQTGNRHSAGRSP